MAENLETLLNNMGGVDDPFALFEPHLWKDKIGDGKWHCELRTHHASLYEAIGNDALEATENCYKLAYAELNKLESN